MSDLKTIAVDFETYYSVKLKYGLKSMIAEQYCADSRFDAYMVSVCDGKTTWAGAVKDLNWQALDGHVWLSHNSYFDQTVFKELRKRGLVPDVKPSAWHCTANLCAYICGRRALDNAAEFLLGVKLDKSDRANAKEKHWPQDFTPAERDSMLKYAGNDAFYCWTLWDKFSAQWPEWEQQLSKLTIEQGQRGVQINEKLLKEYIVRLHDMKTATEACIPWVRDLEVDDEDAGDDWEGFDNKPTSTKCIAEQCRRSKIPHAPKKSEDEEAYEEWEVEYGPKNPWIYALGSWRSINKLYKTLLTMKARLRPDSTMPFELKYFGAHTGRWSGGAKVNFQNPLKRAMICNEHGLKENNEERLDAAYKQFEKTKTYPEWVTGVIDFRSLISSRPGKKMIRCDASQIEPRVLAWLGKNTALLDMIRKGFGVYEAFARTSMGFNEAKLDTKSLYYKMIKIQALGLGYGAGWKKFIAICQGWGVDITKDDPEFIEVYDSDKDEVKKVSGYGQKSREIVQSFRARNTKITDLWYGLDTQFKNSVNSDFVMKLPSGRKMHYRNVRCTLQMVQDPETGKPKRKWVFTFDRGGIRTVTYGGKLTENVTQAAARDVFAKHVLTLDSTPGIRVLFTCHDEAVCECDEHITKEQVETIMSECPEWMAGLPLASEATESKSYG